MEEYLLKKYHGGLQNRLVDALSLEVQQGKASAFEATMTIVLNRDLQTLKEIMQMCSVRIQEVLSKYDVKKRCRERKMIDAWLKDTILSYFGRGDPTTFGGLNRQDMFTLLPSKIQRAKSEESLSDLEVFSPVKPSQAHERINRMVEQSLEELDEHLDKEAEDLHLVSSSNPKNGFSTPSSRKSRDSQVTGTDFEDLEFHPTIYEEEKKKILERLPVDDTEDFSELLKSPKAGSVSPQRRHSFSELLKDAKIIGGKKKFIEEPKYDKVTTGEMSPQTLRVFNQLNYKPPSGDQSISRRTGNLVDELKNKLKIQQAKDQGFKEDEIVEIQKFEREQKPVQQKAVQNFIQRNKHEVFKNAQKQKNGPFDVLKTGLNANQRRDKFFF